MRYLFRHILMRDAVYNMQFRRYLRQMHRRAAETVEVLHGDDLTAHYADLAYHYGQAEMGQYECRYARLAGDQAAAQYANVEAVRYFSQALGLTPRDDLVGRYALILAREKVYALTGEREAQAQDLADLEKLAEELDDDGRRLEAALCQASFAMVSGEFSEASDLAQKAISLAQDASGEAAGCLRWGQALVYLGDYEMAYRQLGRALSLARTAQLRSLEADSLHELGVVSNKRGDYTEAGVCLERALEIRRSTGDRRGESSSLNSLGIASWYRGDYAKAKHYYQLSLDICREIGDRGGESAALNNLGSVLVNQGDYAGAKAYYEQALPIAQETGNQPGRSNILNNLGLVSESLGDYVGAKAYYEQDMSICREAGDRQGEAIALANIGNIYRHLGTYAAARECLERALAIRRDIGDRSGAGRMLSGLSLLFHYMGDDVVAREHSRRALAICQETGHRRAMGYALNNLGHAQAGLGDLIQAAETYKRAVDIRRELEEPHLVVESLAGLARAFLSANDLSRALACVEEILNHLKEGDALGGADEPLRIYLTCYQALTANGDSRAYDILATAFHLLQDRAALIPKGAPRRSFLENVATHREIVALWQSMNQDVR